MYLLRCSLMQGMDNDSSLRSSLSLSTSFTSNTRDGYSERRQQNTKVGQLAKEQRGNGPRTVLFDLLFTMLRSPSL